MTNPDEELLVTTEGVDEGSAASTAEGAGTGAPQDTGGGTDRPTGAQPAPPVDMESDASRAARRESGTGQQQQVGEG